MANLPVKPDVKVPDYLRHPNLQPGDPDGEGLAAAVLDARLQANQKAT